MVPISNGEKIFTLFIMLAGLYLYGWWFNGIISAMVMSREDEELRKEDQLRLEECLGHGKTKYCRIANRKMLHDG